MKVAKESNKVIQDKGFGMQQACGHGQHDLHKHDRDTKHPKHFSAIPNPVTCGVCISFWIVPIEIYQQLGFDMFSDRYGRVSYVCCQ